MRMETTPLMRVLLNSKKTIKVLQGSTGSSKTYTILQHLIAQALTKWNNKTIDIVRRTSPSLRISVMKDFFEILKRHNLYNPAMHNLTHSEYRIDSNLFRFYSSDDEQKMRGPRRDILYLNEVLELKKMDVIQVMLRTRDEIFMDYNPSEEFHWVYDEIITRDDVEFNISTYKDNPFLEPKIVNEIERLQKTDSNLWRIYGLGQRGVAQSTIFTGWDYTDEYKGEGQEFFGLDFGFNDETAMVRSIYHEKEIVSDELLYKTNLTSSMLIAELERLVESGKLKRTSVIYGDSSRPEMIHEIYKAGFNIKPCKKGPDSILRNINFVKRHPVKITKDSVNFIKEMRGYKWRVDKNDRVIDEPVDLHNHLIDALFYSLNEKARNKKAMGVGVL